LGALSATFDVGRWLFAIMFPPQDQVKFVLRTY